MCTESFLKTRNRVFCFFVALFVTCFFTTPCWAESVTSHGVSFKIDHVTPTGAGSSIVVVKDSSEIISDENIPSYVATKYFSNRDLFQSLESSQVQDFIVNASRDNDIQGAAVALQAVSKFGDGQTAESSKLFDRMSHEANGPSVFKIWLTEGELESVSPGDVSAAIVSVSLTDSEWIHEKVSPLLYTYSAALRTYLRERLLEALHSEDLSLAVRYQGVMKELFGAEDAEAKSFEVLLLKVKQLAQRDKDVGSTLSELSEDDPALRKYLGPLFMERVHSKAQEALDAHDPEKALTILAQVEPDKRTPLTHSLVGAALKDLPAGSSIAAQPKVIDLVEKIAGKDPRVQEEYLLFLERFIRAKILEGHIDEGETGFMLMAKIRQEPNTLNDALRISVALTALKKNEPKIADKLLGQVGTGIPLVDRFQLFIVRVMKFKGIMIGGLVLLIFTLLFIKCIPLILRLLASKERKEEPVKAPVTEKVEEDDAPIRPFVTNKGRTSGLPQQYLEDLYELDLSPDASLKEIKTAFRNRVKTIHPDFHPEQNATSNQFLRVKAVYERILETRRRLGLDT